MAGDCYVAAACLFVVFCVSETRGLEESCLGLLLGSLQKMLRGTFNIIVLFLFIFLEESGWPSSSATCQNLRLTISLMLSFTAQLPTR